jgi:hypothetical protein
MDGRGHDPMTFKRNLQSFGYSLLIRVWSACLFFGQIGGKDATLLPEMLFFDFYLSIQHFNQKSAIGVKFPRKNFP